MTETLTKEKKQGLIGSILVHLILLLLFIFFGLTYQVPAPNTGIALNFGMDEAGTGDIQPVSNIEPTPPPPEQSQPTAAPESGEKVMTQDDPDALAVKSDPKEAERKRKEAEEAERLRKEAIKKQEEEDKKRKEEEAFKNKINSAFSNKNNNATSQGTGKGTGDEGSPNGDEHMGNSMPGVGPGNAVGPGGSGRTWNEVVPQGVQNEEGKVEVLVYVDASGKVTKASIHKSTNSALNANALAAAKKWVFSDQPKLGSNLQKIIIPFVFTY